MRYSKRYLTFAVILGALLVPRISSAEIGNLQVSGFRGANLRANDWNPLIAGEMNKQNVKLSVGSHSYTNKNDGIYVSDDLSLMVTPEVLRDALNCSANVYADHSMTVQKRDTVCVFNLYESAFTVNGETQEGTSPMTRIGRKYYISLNDLAPVLGYDFNMDFSASKANGVDTMSDISALPSRYDLREHGKAPKVKNQGNNGTCWALATLTALESTMLPEQTYEFAPDHITLANSFNINPDSGGDYAMSMAYLASWQGPVLEADDPYGDGETDKSLTARCHVQDMQIMEAGEFNDIKAAVFKYGGVQTSIYTTLRGANAQGRFYNPDTFAYCYQGNEKPNHDVVIIGWDDGYSKDNFSNPPEADGAFICQNSWGKDFADNGIFYVSYYDSNIGIHNLVISGVEPADNYDRIYQSDLCGSTGQIGYDRDSIYAANIYTSKGNELIKAAGFYAGDTNSTYELYAVKDYNGTSSLSEENRIKVAEGLLSNAGFYTIKFDEAVPVQAGESFAIILHIVTPNADYPMAVEYASEDLKDSVVLYDGEGYISLNGKVWDSVETKSNSNLCLKAYTDKQE
ncbi:MAG: cell surface protein [Lachnospiraceae bacterium]|nr:cell surface protein [Lachnospiraceae bacterium]